MNDEWYAARIRTFLLQYSRAVVDQQEGRCVIVYTDESYVNVNHARKFTWYHPEAPEKNDVVRASGKGKRLVLLHAFTQDGWLTRDSAIHNGRVDQCALSCELIYQADKDGGDYHNNMNGSMYMQWLINRLLPSFAERYPGQKMVLILDNAAYHHHRGADWINPHRLKKAEMAAKLIELGVSSISIQRQKKGTLSMEQHVFDAASFARHGGRHAPTLAELKAELMMYLAAHPGMNRTEVAKLFAAHRHELIYTPPYQPGVQPIERLWAYVKNHVASQYKRGRTVSELILQTYQGFYGDGLQHAGVDAVLCTRVIKHSHNFCNDLIEQDDALSGTIDHLSSESVVVPPDIEEDINADMDPFPEADVEEDEQR
jgi:transposase